MAEHSAQVLSSAVLLARHLQIALTRRAVIDQAIGVVGANTGHGPHDAFARLRLLARTQNITLVEVCQRTIDDAIADQHMNKVADDHASQATTPARARPLRPC